MNILILLLLTMSTILFCAVILVLIGWILKKKEVENYIKEQENKKKEEEDKKKERENEKKEQENKKKLI